MFSRCCIGLLLLSLLPAFVPARETAPRIDLRHGVRPDTIRLKAEDLKLGLPCDSVYLKRRDSLRRNDSLRRQAEQRNQRLYDSIRSKTTRRAVPRLLYRMLFVNPVLDTTANGRVLDESRQFERYSGRRIGEVVIAQDPVFTPDGNWLERTGNKLHVMTRATSSCSVRAPISRMRRWS